MRFLNEYFFGEEKISLHDTFWFYGTLVGLVVLTIFVVCATH